MPIFLQENDQIALAAAWKERSDKVFQEKIVSDFTELMLNKIMHRDIAAELLECIKHAKKPSEICVSWGLCFEPNHYFMAEGLRQEALLHQADHLQDQRAGAAC